MIIVVATALAFDFTNGFHDTANVVATSISTRAMAPRLAVGYAAILNFVGAFISLKVAATVASDVVDPESITLLIVFAGLVGAIAWNLITWYFGLPVELLARADRRDRGRDAGGPGAGRDLLRGRHHREGDGAGAGGPDARVRRGRRLDRPDLPDRRPAAPGPGDAAASAAAR